jgi:hypothetical protein
MRRGVMEQMVSLISLGDGSTLTLDFTTGVLDSRLTFTRASDATFINSQGFVQYAAVNYFRNTGWTSGTTPTGWNVTFGTGTTTWNADGTLTMTAGGSAVRPCINATAFSVAQGIPFTFGFRVTAVSGSPTIDQVISSTVAGETFSRNGATVSGSTVVQNGDIISCTFTPTTTSNAARMGPGVNVGVTNISITITQPQFNPGTTLQPYYANTSTIAARWDSARFDHDPTTLAPRGLLVEGQVQNLVTYSNDFSVGFWALDNSGATNPSVSTVSQTGPDGAATVTRITFNKTGGAFSRIRNTVTSVASQPHTMSVWMKANTASGGAATQNVGLRIGGDFMGFNCVVTTTWKRFQYTYTLSGTDATAQILLWDNIAGNDETADVLVYGCQIEQGSGASSYIPTGASQATRVADECVMTGTNFSSWFNAGSSYSMLFRYSLNNPSAFAGASVDRCAGTLSVSGGGNRTFIHAAYRTTSGSGDEGRFVRVFDTGSLDLSPATLPAAASNTRLAFAVDTNNAGLSAANQSLGTDSGCTILTGQNQLELGKVGASQFINGCISLVKYWPTRLPNAQLQSLTT